MDPAMRLTIYWTDSIFGKVKEASVSAEYAGSGSFVSHMLSSIFMTCGTNSVRTYKGRLRCDTCSNEIPVSI